MANKNYDFCGWATRNNIRCSDGRTIRMDAFKENDGKIVPLVWNHKHDDGFNVLGHALLENRNDGVYAYCTFNDTDQGRNAKALVDHGDVSALSIYANQLKQKGGDVIHGLIREVSLVLAGANPGAKIETVVMHSDDDSEEELYVICEYADELEHSDADSEENIETEEEKSMNKNEEVIEHAEESEETVQDVIDTMNEKQQRVLYALVGAAMSDEEDDEDEEDENNEEDAEVKHNVFDNETETNENVLSHSDMAEIIKNAKRSGSMKAAFEDAGIESITYLQHDDEPSYKYGVQNPYGIMGKSADVNSLGVDALFPDARNYTQTPQWISRNMEWVSKFLNAASHSPFSRVKTMFADITEDEARARGYIKGTLKKEVFSLLKRVTEPTTIYKKQKMDRDDVIDITDFDVIAWIKAEMRVMLNEEIARAALIGDGRVSGTDGKIDETHIRPIYTDTDFFTIKTTVTAGADDNATAKNIIKAAVRSRKNYKGSGNPTLFTTEDTLTDMLMIEDTTGRAIYDTKEKLCNALRVSDIVTVELMENVSRSVSGTTKNLIGIIVNPRDYNFGADKGGAINMFDDFDIDYNQMKYLIETRCSGALVRPYSAIVLEMNAPVAQGGQA